MDYPTPAKRPYYSLMDKSETVKHFSYTIPYWKDSLKECIAKIKGIDDFQNDTNN